MHIEVQGSGTQTLHAQPGRRKQGLRGAVPARVTGNASRPPRPGPNPPGRPAPAAQVTTNAPTLGVSVINLSLGGTGTANDPICASIRAAVNRGIIVVVAAGERAGRLAGPCAAGAPGLPGWITP